MPPPTPLRPHPERRPSWIARFVKLIVGLAIVLAAAEAALYYRDGGAFPALNLYVADAELGVRLMPGATEKLSVTGNPITQVRINRDGFRGAELPEPGTGELLVVGDSQVFGLGVEEDQTFAAVLGRSLATPVVNAGVPTYGPVEYRAVIAAQLARRHPRTVLLTLNLVDDLFEVGHANRERHTAWNGWAMRKETAPAEISDFPGRELLYRQSHLFFFYRMWGRPDASSSAWPSWRDSDSADPALATLDARVGELARLAALDVQTLPVAAYLRDIQQLVTGGRARLVVVILPIDVQGASDEAKKHGLAATGSESSKALTAKLAELCRALEVSVLDATPVLAAAEPGAFLAGDVHLAARGHAAIAVALEQALAAPAAQPSPSPTSAPLPPSPSGAPPERTLVP